MKNQKTSLTETQQHALQILKSWFSYAFEKSTSETLHNIWLLVDYIHNDLDYIHEEQYKRRAINFIQKLESSGRAQDDIETVKKAIFLFDNSRD